MGSFHLHAAEPARFRQAFSILAQYQRVVLVNGLEKSHENLQQNHDMCSIGQVLATNDMCHTLQSVVLCLASAKLCLDSFDRDGYSVFYRSTPSTPYGVFRTRVQNLDAYYR
jgi:hypothetical protein